MSPLPPSRTASPDGSCPAVVLLSGGMDSATCLWWLTERVPPRAVHTVGVDYGQRHRVELECAQRLSRRAGAASHRVLSLDLAAVGGSPLTDEALDLPAAAEDRQSATVVPFRNLLFVALAAACAEVLGGGRDLYIAPVRDDDRAYRDCRRGFYDSLERTLNLGAARAATFRIHTPLVEKTKVEVVALGLELGVPYELTHSCYAGRRPACGVCDACAERIGAFRANGVADPLAYEIDVDWT